MASNLDERIKKSARVLAILAEEDEADAKRNEVEFVANGVAERDERNLDLADARQFMKTDEQDLAKIAKAREALLAVEGARQQNYAARQSRAYRYTQNRSRREA